MLMVTLFWGILAVIKSSQIPTEFSNRISIKNVVPIDSKSVNISWIYDDESLTSDIPTLTTIKINSDNNNNNKSSLPVQYFKLQTRNFSDVNSDWLDLVSVKPEYRFTIVDKLIPTKDYAFRLAAFSPHSDQLITSSNGPTSSSLSLANHTSDTINDQLVNNAKQSSQWSYANITMPAESPPSITSLKLLRRTNKTIWIGWTKPSHDSGADISEYQLELQHRNGTRLYNETLSMNRETSGSKNLMFMFVGLEPAENYTIQVRACTSNVCGKWSDPQLRVSTLDGVSGPPNNVSIACLYDANKSVETISISWDAPLNPKGTIIGYTVSLVGSALFRNQDNQIESDSFKKAYHMDKNQTNLVLSDTKPNTNYSVQICTINESGCGELSELSSSTKCSTRPTLPNDLPSHLQLTLFNYNDPFCRRLKLKIPRISERNGPIKCYKVVIIKLPKNADYEQVLPVNSSDVNITSYDSVHLSSSSINQRQENNLTIGAYIAEEVSPEDLDHEIVIGDDDYTTCEDSRTPRRIGVSLSDESQSSALSSSLSYTPLYTATKLLEDGPLDFLTNYTGFLEVKVSGPDNTSLIKRTNYFTPVQSGALDPSFKEHSSNFAPILSSFSEPAAAVLFGIVCGLTLVLFSILSVICFLRKQVDEYSDSGEEEVRLGLTSLFRRAANGKSRQVLTNGGILSNGHKWIGQPISIHNLPNIFIERHADGDALFQQEFKALPETFHNRTSHDSSLPENILKNRYPDIKCYDQTRVKLKPIDGVQGSDYINANFVEGYKSRKVYICAQGPTERTVSDFWRMIDEHKVSVIVMLTGIEENGKVKCAQYWNESGTKEIDNLFKVTLRSCVKYSDFLMRRFDLRQLSSSEEDEYPRDILHFHFLLWKDFLAPEQPSWILRFIKRVNEHFSPDRGPILVHCSAGVGRTGTFIAIDSLIPEITSAKTVNIFECVSQLRYQRNFLVQSFKQYIFIYRALMEFAQFGDTEIEICHLKEYYRQMKEQKFEGNINGVVAEFDRLNEVIEDAKSCCVGSLEMNMTKNRYNFIIPYDINRVILSPLPNKDNSTYINASFVQGYDRNLSFIVTQDPLENTIQDFWRMTVEQNITTIVMFSESLSKNGEGQSKCPRYWPTVDEPLEFENIRVCLNSEDYKNEDFIIRNFTVTKNSDSFTVNQYCFLSWRTGVVPETTRPLLMLVETIWKNHSTPSWPIITHCTGGGDRSSLFITISSLIQQITIDGHIDIFQTARYTRSQRACMLQTIGQYDFIYRCLIDYIESHNLDDSMSDTQL